MDASKKNEKKVVVLDCDGTITKKGNALIKVVVEHACPKSASDDMQVLREKNYAVMQEGFLTAEENRAWILEEIRVMTEHGVSVAAIKKALARTSPHYAIRPGVYGALRKLHQRNVKVAIVSFGAYEFIAAMLATHGMSAFVDEIYALKFKVNQSGAVIGHSEETMVIPENKGEWSRRFADKHGVPHENIIAVGDSQGDRFLGHHHELRLGLAAHPEEAAHIAPHFGQVVISETFDKAWDWISSHLP